MKKTAKIITVILCCAAIALSSAIFAHAASAQAAISAPKSVKVGSEFTVTVKITSSAGMGSVDSILKYNANTVEFVSGNDANGASGMVTLVKWSQSSAGDKNFTFSLKFKAKATGSSGFTMSGTEVSDYNFVKMTVNNPSATTQITADIPLSSNNYLSSLKLSSGSLSPGFSKNTTSYTVNVPNSVTTMRVTAKCEDSKAKATAKGTGNLKVGTNTITVTVEAENGSTKKYTIKVVRAAAQGESLPPSSQAESSKPPVQSQAPSTTVFIDGTEYTVVESFDGIAVPEGFAQTVCTVNGTQVMAVSNKTNAIIMLYLKADGQDPSFFIYDSAEITYIPYRTLTVGENIYIPLSQPRGLAIPSGFNATELTIGEQAYSAWVSDAEKDFYMLYLCNINGNPTLYIYDTAEGTLQRHQNLEVISVNEPINDDDGDGSSLLSLGSLWFYVSAGLAVALIGITVTVIVLAVKLSKAKKERLRLERESIVLSDSDFDAIEQELAAPKSEPSNIGNENADGGESLNEDGNGSFSDDFIIK